jgi:hypothetical protein
VTLNSRGETTTTVGAPDTGIYWTQRKKVGAGGGANAIVVMIGYVLGWLTIIALGFLLGGR